MSNWSADILVSTIIVVRIYQMEELTTKMCILKYHLEVMTRKSLPETKDSDQGCSEGVLLRFKIPSLAQLGWKKVLCIVVDMLN